MRAPPPLALLAALASLLDLFGTRLWVRVLSNREVSGLTHGVLIDLKRGGDFVRNLAAVAGLIALALALTEMIQPRAHGGLKQRVGIAGFAGIFLPTAFLATVLPAPRTTPVVVLFAAGAANLLAVVLGISSLRWPGPRVRRVALAGVAATAFFAFTSTVILLIGRITLWSAGYPLGVALRRVGEITWLLSLLGFAWAFRPRGLPRARWVPAAIGGGAVAIAALAAFVSARRHLEPEAHAQLLYGALHADLLVGVPWVYAAVVATAAGVGVAGALAPEPSDRQGAAGLLLLLSAGFAPTTPATLLMMVLGVTLVGRASVARSTLAHLRGRAQELKELQRELDDAEVAPADQDPGPGAEAP